MEKPAAKSSKIKLFKYLPKAASAIRFQNLPFSPGKNKKSDTISSKLDSSSLDNRFPGPIRSIISSEAKQKPKISSSFEAQEPTSPRISCIGQIKHRKGCAKSKLFLIPDEMNTYYSTPFVSKHNPSILKPVLFLPDANKKLSVFRKPGKNPGKDQPGKEPGKYPDIASVNRCFLLDKAPSLSQMTRFSSCRGESMADFNNWIEAQIGADHELDEWKCFSSDEEEEDEYEEALVHFLAPISHVSEGRGLAMEPRKEINLWKRRTICQPMPLQIHT